MTNDLVQVVLPLIVEFAVITGLFLISVPILKFVINRIKASSGFKSSHFFKIDNYLPSGEVTTLK